MGLGKLKVREGGREGERKREKTEEAVVTWKSSASEMERGEILARNTSGGGGGECWREHDRVEKLVRRRKNKELGFQKI